MNADRISPAELAKILGKRSEWAIDELRRDSKREVKQWPFATSVQGKTGRWSYVINRQQFDKWFAGESVAIDYERLADMVAARVIEQLRGA